MDAQVVQSVPHGRDHAFDHDDIDLAPTALDAGRKFKRQL